MLTLTLLAAALKQAPRRKPITAHGKP